MQLHIVIEVDNKIYNRTIEPHIWKEFPVLANLVEDMGIDNNESSIPIVLPEYTSIQDFDCLMNKEKWMMLTIGAIFIGSYLGHEYGHSIKIRGKKYDCIDKKIMFLGKKSDGKNNNMIVSLERLARNASYGYCKYGLTIETTYDDANILGQIDFSDHYTSNDQDWLNSKDIEEYHSDYDNKDHSQTHNYYKKILEPKFSLSNKINLYQLTVQEINLLDSVKTHADKSNLLAVFGNLLYNNWKISPRR